MKNKLSRGLGGRVTSIITIILTILWVLSGADRNSPLLILICTLLLLIVFWVYEGPRE